VAHLEQQQQQQLWASQPPSLAPSVMHSHNHQLQVLQQLTQQAGAAAAAPPAAQPGVGHSWVQLDGEQEVLQSSDGAQEFEQQMPEWKQLDVEEEEEVVQGRGSARSSNSSSSSSSSNFVAAGSGLPGKAGVAGGAERAHPCKARESVVKRVGQKKGAMRLNLGRIVG